jgi:hypothetical protein
MRSPGRGQGEMTTGGTGPEDEFEGHPSAQEAARYIADVTGGIALIARKAGLEVLAYILDMARLEAEETAERGKPQ